VSASDPKPLPHLGEEFGTAKKNLPPAKIILIGVAAVLVIGTIFVFVERPQASAAGTIDNIAAVSVPDQNSTIAAISVSFQNQGKRNFYVRDIRAELDAPGGPFTDEALSVVDFDRYYQAFPALKENSYPPLKRETKIGPGESLKGTLIVGFPVTQDVFNSRKSLKVTIEPYDQPVPLVITK
jgi:hypothetical protein